MKYNYIARTKEGTLQTGIIEAASKEAAVDILQSHNLIIIGIELIAETPFWARGLGSLIGVSNRELVIFTRQLSILFEAMVPIIESLKTMVEQTGNKSLKLVMGAILEDVDGGMSLSRAMARHPKVFSSFYISMVKSGEVSGKLQEVLSYMADHLEREYALTSKARNAMIYPAFVFTVFIGVGVLMLVMVIPQLTAVFTESGQELPFLTRLLMGTSDFVRSWGWILGIVIVILGAIVWRYKKTPQGKFYWDLLKLKSPIFGNLFQKLYLARFSENLSTLIVGGLPITQALMVTGDVVGNDIFKRIIQEAKEEVEKGAAINTVLRRHSEVVPPLTTQMVTIGENTGKLDMILGNLAKFYQRDVANLVDNIVQLIEPIMIVVLGLMVGGLVASILLPIYNLAGAI